MINPKIEEMLNELIRDITKVGFMTKSEVRKRLETIFAEGYAKGRTKCLEQNRAELVKEVKNQVLKHWRQMGYISKNKDILGGTECIRGTRLSVKNLLLDE